jgi:hypothetical protein
MTSPRPRRGRSPMASAMSSTDMARKKEIDAEIDDADEVVWFLGSKTKDLLQICGHHAPTQTRVRASLKCHTLKDIENAREENAPWLLHLCQNVILSGFYRSHETCARLKDASSGGFDDERLGEIDEMAPKSMRSAASGTAGTKRKTLKDLYRALVHAQYPDLWPKKAPKAEVTEHKDKDKATDSTRILDELIATMEKSGTQPELLELYRSARPLLCAAAPVTTMPPRRAPRCFECRAPCRSPCDGDGANGINITTADDGLIDFCDNSCIGRYFARKARSDRKSELRNLRRSS